MKNPKIGIQLYSVRTQMAEDFRGTLAKLAEMGFEGFEFAFDFGGEEPSALANFLKEINVEAIGIYAKFADLMDADAEVYRMAKALDCKPLAFGIGNKSLENEFEACLENARTAMKVARDKGFDLCYHAHAHEFAARDGSTYLDLILNAPGLNELGFEADTCWIQRGGEDVVGYMEKYADRIPILHVKDTTADGEFRELGRGIIDFSAVVDFARRKEIPWLGYEQDQTTLTGLDSAQISIEHLKSLLQ